MASENQAESVARAKCIVRAPRLLRPDLCELCFPSRSGLRPPALLPCDDPVDLNALSRVARQDRRRRPLVVRMLETATSVFGAPVSQLRNRPYE